LRIKEAVESTTDKKPIAIGKLFFKGFGFIRVSRAPASTVLAIQKMRLAEIIKILLISLGELESFNTKIKNQVPKPQNKKERTIKISNIKRFFIKPPFKD
jgi:hypothetical protein